VEKKVMVTKFGDSFGWRSETSLYAHGVGCWKYIHVHLDLCKSLVNFEVENESRVLLWHDTWCRGKLLKVHFPNLFLTACLKNATVQEVLSRNGVSPIGTILLQDARMIAKRKTS